MVTQYGIKLAVHIITTHFGELVAKVCQCLLQKGTLTLGEIIRFSDLTPQQVKNSLLVLIQHNCVQAFAIEQEGAFGEAPKVVTQYLLVFENIIHRMRFSKFLSTVSQELGKECEELLEGLLQHGRLTVEQVLSRATSNLNEGHSAVQDSVRKSFIRLASARYVERCPASEPFLALPTDEETPAKKRGPKSAKVAEVLETIEQRALAAAVPMEAKRFLIITNSRTNHGENSEQSTSTEKLGEKRKHDVLEVDRELGAKVCEKEVLWRPNFEEFLLRLRNEVCVANVRSRMDEGAAIVLRAMLEATRASQTTVKAENSAPLSLGTISEEVIKSPEGRSMTLERIKASLSQLGCKQSVDELYSIDLKSIIESAQNDEVESIVLKRYGREAYRMFRLLLKTCQLLETDKISDTTFVEKKDTAMILYKLWKDDYLIMEKLITQGPRQLQFLLWKVNKQTLWKHVLDEMYHAALNLTQRMAYELDQGREILQQAREKIVGESKKKFERLKKVRMLLESSLMKLDDAIMLFQDF